MEQFMVACTSHILRGRPPDNKALCCLALTLPAPKEPFGAFGRIEMDKHVSRRQTYCRFSALLYSYALYCCSTIRLSLYLDA